MKENIKALNNKSVESSLGWRVDILSIDCFQYSQGSKTIKLEIEDHPDAGGELEWIIYLPAHWIWNDVNHGELIAPEKVSEILSRIEMAFWKLDMKIKEYV
jgi:hypothetical protein